MLSVAKLAPGREAYYEKSVAAGREEYLSGQGEAPGVWIGAGATRLGLSGEVARGALGVLLAGSDPTSGARLRRVATPRAITLSSINPESGVVEPRTRMLDPVAGFDLVFSVPKSVSVLAALTDDPAIRLAVRDAHEEAWRAALGYLEREGCVIRRGRNGVHREPGAGFVAAAFRHRTSRAHDPHLHTHVVIANTSSGADGRHRALDGDLILRRERLTAGYLYEAHLRDALTRRLGVCWTTPVKGMSEIIGIPNDALRAFSTRRVAVEEQLARTGDASWHAAQTAALSTRARKTPVEMRLLEDEWQLRAADHGLDAAVLTAALGREREPALHRDRPLSLAVVVLGASGVTAHETTFTRSQLLRAVCDQLPAGASVTDVEALTDALLALPAVTRLDTAVDQRDARYTTTSLLRLEQDALARATARHARHPLADPRRVAAVLAASPTLDDDQRAAVLHACLEPGRVVCIVGQAGAGKTTMTRAIHDAYAASSVVVIGCAPSAIAADTLQAATGIPSSTIHRLTNEINRYGALPDGCLVVLDEASMADTRTLAPLLRHVADADGRLVMIGDPAQLDAVAAGGLFAELATRLGAAELTTNHRHHDPAERDHLQALRAGDAERYLGWATATSRISISATHDEAVTSLVDAWWRDAQHDLEGAIMIAYTRADVTTLNTQARDRLAAAGLLGGPSVATPNGPISVGDRVLCLRNDPSLGVINGMRGTITTLHPDDSLKLTLPDGSNVEVSASYLAAGHVRHGYALTGHATQGITVDHAHILAPTVGDQKEWGYVALSRARHTTHLYLANPPAGDFLAPLDRAAAALSHSTSDLLATVQRTVGAEIGW